MSVPLELQRNVVSGNNVLMVPARCPLPLKASFIALSFLFVLEGVYLTMVSCTNGLEYIGERC